MSHLTNLSTADRAILEQKPAINFRLPEKRVGQQGTRTEEQTIEKRAERVAEIVNSYRHIEILSGLAQAKIDARSRNFAVPLSPRVDQTVIASMRRAFPGETPTKITHDQYRRALEYLTSSSLTQAKKYSWTKEERQKKKQSGEILTNVWRDKMAPGALRPELEHEIIPQIDMDEHQKNLVLILFEQMVPLLVGLIKSIIDPLFSSDGAAPGELSDDNLNLPSKLTDLQDKINTKATELVQNRDKNKLTSAFSIPQLSQLDETVTSKGVNPVSVADAALISQTFERAAHYSLDPQSSIPPLSRPLQGNRIFARHVVDTLSQNLIQDNTQPTQQDRQFVKDGLPPEDREKDPITEEKKSTNRFSQAIIDINEFSAADQFFNREDPEDFVNFLDDLAKRNSEGPKAVIPVKGGPFDGMQFSNSFVMGAGDDAGALGKNLLADCIPCADRLLDILEFQPGAALLDIFAADIRGRLSGLTSIADLLTDDSFRSEFCALIRFLSFMCVPDLQAIVAALISLMMSMLASPLGVIGIADFALSLITPLFTPILNGLSGLLAQLAELILAPLVCIIDSVNAQIAKLNTAGIFDADRAAEAEALTQVGIGGSSAGTFQQTLGGGAVTSASRGLSSSSAFLSSIPGEIQTGVQAGIDKANTRWLGGINQWIADAHDNLVRITEDGRKKLEDMLDSWAIKENQFLLSTQKLMELKRLIGIVIFVIDTHDGNPVCRDPFAEGSLGAKAKEVAERLFPDTTIDFNPEEGTIRFREPFFEAPPDLQPYRGSPQAGDPQRSTRTEFDNLIEFAGEDLLTKLSQPTDVTVPMSVLCGGKTSNSDIDKINSIIRDLNRVNI